MIKPVTREVVKVVDVPVPIGQAMEKVLQHAGAAAATEEETVLRQAAAATAAKRDTVLRQVAAVKEDTVQQHAAGAATMGADVLQRAGAVTAAKEDRLLQHAAAAADATEDIVRRQVAAAKEDIVLQRAAAAVAAKEADVLQQAAAQAAAKEADVPWHPDAAAAAKEPRGGKGGVEEPDLIARANPRASWLGNIVGFGSRAGWDSLGEDEACTRRCIMQPQDAVLELLRGDFREGVLHLSPPPPPSLVSVWGPFAAQPPAPFPPDHKGKGGEEMWLRHLS